MIGVALGTGGAVPGDDARAADARGRVQAGGRALLGVRVGRMFTVGWALAAMAGALAGVLVAPSVFLGPNSFDPILISGFVAAVLGGLDSPPGAVVGGIMLGLALSYVSGYEGSAAGSARGARDPGRRADGPPERAVLGSQGAPGMSARQAQCWARSTLARSLALVDRRGARARGLQQRDHGTTTTCSSPRAPTTSRRSPG